MYSFEGKFRTTPTVSLGGRSKRGKLDKEELLEKAQKERQKREDIRQRLQSALILQSSVRSYLIRQKLKTFFRDQFDQERRRVQKDSKSIETLIESSKWLKFFYKPNTDDDRLTWFGQQLLNKKQDWVMNDDDNLFKTSGIIKLCCRCLLASGQAAQIAIPLRILETFTAPDLIKNSRNLNNDAAKFCLLKLWNALLKNDYFDTMLHLFTARVPSNISPPDEDDSKVHPPTPLAETLLNLLARPVFVAGLTSEGKSSGQSSERMDYAESTNYLQNSILKTFISQVLCKHPTTQMYYYAYYALARLRAFPVSLILKVTRELLEDEKEKISYILLPALTRLTDPVLDSMPRSTFAEYLYCLKFLILQLPLITRVIEDDLSSSDEDSDDESAIENIDRMDFENYEDQSEVIPLYELVADCHDALISYRFIDACVTRKIHEYDDSDCFDSICAICYHLIALPKTTVQKNRLLYTLAFSASFLRKLWKSIVTMTAHSRITGKSISVTQLLFEKTLLTKTETSSIQSKLVVFSALFTYNLLSVHDTDFYNATKASSRHMSFTTNELVSISITIRDVAVSLIKRAFPETKCRLGSLNAKNVLHALSFGHPIKLQKSFGHKFHEDEITDFNNTVFLFKICTRLVKHLHTRDARRSFVPQKSYWLSNSIFFKSEQSSDFAHRWHQRSENLTVADHLANTADENAIVSVTEARQLALLMNIPFVIPFETRVSIITTMLSKDRSTRESERAQVLEAAGHGISSMTNEVAIRREFLYEDAFNDLSKENAPDLRRRLRVTFVNVGGVNEAGYGAGVTREFLQQIIKTGFDPTRGFFKSTAQGRLYPNPHATIITADANDHFYFLGRILGKVIYEGMQVELPFAAFFLCKILQRKNTDVDINHLQSLDPDFYKNLMFLRDFDGDISELDLNFTVVNEKLGVTEVTELVPDGKNITVTNSNKVRYMHLMADYKLNIQMRLPCLHFRRGLESVITVDWLQMFDHEEFQTLISGAEIPIDIDDMEKHSAYSGGYVFDHPTIKAFWKVIRSFTNEQLGQLLLFVTSCSRPPLLGFKELHPPFCIQKGGTEDRLPTASTCLNLLKLPEYSDEASLKTKLLYCLQSGTGFELS